MLVLQDIPLSDYPNWVGRDAKYPYKTPVLMSLNRYAAKTDASQGEIVMALRQAGVDVWVIGWPVDLLLHHRNRFSVMECKAVGARPRKSQTQQQDFCRQFGVPIVHTAEEALLVLGLVPPKDTQA